MSGGGGDSDNEIKDTPEQRYLAQVSAEKWNYAQNNLVPLENEYMDRVNDLDSESRKSYLKGVTNQGAMNNFSQGLAGANSQMAQAGINPNSGRWTGTQTQLADQAAHVGGEATARAGFQQQQEKAKGLQNIIAMGSGQESRATNGLGDIASQSVSDASNKAVSNYNRNSANLQLLGSLAGGATRGGLYANDQGWFGGNGSGS